MGRKSKEQIAAETPDLGYKLTVSEVGRVQDVAQRMLNELENSNESREELNAAFCRLAEQETPSTVDIIARLQNSISWEKVLLEGAINDARYIIARLNNLVTRLQLDAAMKIADEEQIIKETF